MLAFALLTLSSPTVAEEMVWQEIDGQEINGQETQLVSYEMLLQRIDQLESESRLGQHDPVAADQLRTLESQLAAQESSLRQLRNELNGGQSDSSSLFVNYESVILQPTLSNSTAFIASNDPNFDHVLFDWNLEHSPRVEIGYLAGSDGLGWRARYWHFRHHTAFFANEANGLIPTDEGIIGFFSEDGDIVIGIADVDTGTFSNAIRTDVVDLELEKRSNSRATYLAGIRYGQIRQQYAADTDEGIARSSSQFHGLGPTVAMSLNHAVVPDRLSLFGTVRGSLLYGAQSFSAWDDISNVRLNAINENAFATNGEIQLGFRLIASDLLSMHFAVEAQHWGDVGGANPTAFYAGVDHSVDSDGPNDDDLGLIGMNIGATLTW